MTKGTKTTIKSKPKKAKKTLKVSDFVHLHNHTHHSVLDGLTKIPKLVKKIKDCGMEACAITDHGTMSGVIEFYQNCHDQQIKPIIGIETYVAARGHMDKDITKDKMRYHLTLLAMDNQGYENLMRLSSTANIDGMYFKPRIDKQLLKQYSEGVICLSGCMGGELSDELKNGNYQKAKQVAEEYQAIFGDRYYIEVQEHGHPNAKHSWSEQVKITPQQLQIAEELGIKIMLAIKF